MQRRAEVRGDMEARTALDGGLSQLSTGLLLPDAVHRIFEEGQVRMLACSQFRLASRCYIARKPPTREGQVGQGVERLMHDLLGSTA